MVAPSRSALVLLPICFKSMDQKTLWKSVLTELELSLSKANFQTWFKGKTEVTAIEETTIEIGCNSPYTKDWLEQRYLGQIKAALDRLTETNNSIIFSVSKNLKLENGKKAAGDQNSTATLFNEPETSRLQERLEASKLSSNYTFENFVVVSSNQLAFAVGKAVSESPGKIYNPLFLYGGVGLGK